MLLIEWDYWHERIPVLEAEERFSAYTIAMMAHPEWKFDREQVLQGWRAAIERRLLGKPLRGDLEDDQAGAVRRGARRVAGWVRAAFGGGVSEVTG